LRLHGGGCSHERTLLRLNSLLTGKNTGNFVNSIGSFRPLAAVNASICVTSAARAKSWLGIEQGIIRGLSGNSKPLIRELSFLSLMSPAPLVPSSPFGLRVADAPSPPFRTSYKPVSRELTPTGTSAHRRQHVQVTSPNRTSGPRRYAVVSTPIRDPNRTGRSSGITCEMAISQHQPAPRPFHNTLRVAICTCQSSDK
jgi:hypothetical protein